MVETLAQKGRKTFQGANANAHRTQAAISHPRAARVNASSFIRTMTVGPGI